MMLPMASFLPLGFSGTFPAGPSAGSDAPGGWHTRSLLMLFVVGALSMGFGALLAFYVIMWARAESWPPAGTPALPASLWLSTAVLVASSVTMQLALYGARKNFRVLAAIFMMMTTLLALAFLVSQTVSWVPYLRAALPVGERMFATCFFLLTGSHALHVVAALIPLLITTVKALRFRYGPADYAGVLYCAVFWHFLDAVWLVIFFALFSSGMAGR